MSTFAPSEKHLQLIQAENTQLAWKLASLSVLKGELTLDSEGGNGVREGGKEMRGGRRGEKDIERGTASSDGTPFHVA